MTELSVLDGGNGRRAGAGLPAVTAPPGPGEWEAMKQQASVIARSGLAPRSVSKPEQVLVIALKGRELSIPPMQALSQIHIVEGKPTLSAELMAALVQRAGHKLRVLETSSRKCVVEGVRADDPGHPSRVEWTIEDAKTAGVANKGPWKSYPAAMLRARAISALCRFAFADVLMGASYTPEELGAEVNEEGEVLSVPDRTEAAQRAEEPVEDAEVVEEGPASEKQSGYLKGLMRDLGVNRIKIEERNGPVEGWSADKVSGWIDQLQERKKSASAQQEQPSPADARPDEEEPKATPADLKLLRALADDAHGEREEHLSGHEWLEREIGTPFEEMTGSEVHELIEELNNEEQA